MLLYFSESNLTENGVRLHIYYYLIFGRLEKNQNQWDTAFVSNTLVFILISCYSFGFWLEKHSIG